MIFYAKITMNFPLPHNFKAILLLHDQKIQETINIFLGLFQSLPDNKKLKIKIKIYRPVYFHGTKIYIFRLFLMIECISLNQASLWIG